MTKQLSCLTQHAVDFSGITKSDCKTAVKPIQLVDDLLNATICYARSTKNQLINLFIIIIHVTQIL